jgi:DNA-directed RNA polymerase specialized sigma24 family protein
MNSTEINALLEEHDAYILALSHKMLAGRSATQNAYSIDVEDLIQQVRIKFWQALERQTITYYKTYIRQIVCHELVNLWRQRRPESSLPLNTEGELVCHNYNLLKKCASTQDPAETIEQQEVAQELLNWAACQTTHLPCQQRHAMICELKDQVDDLSLLKHVFQANQIAIEKFDWPQSSEATHNLKASISPARKKFRLLWKL